MNASITNKYSDIDIETLNASEISELRRGLECDMSWIEHELSELSFGSEYNLKLDQLQICQKLYKKLK